MNQPIIIFTQEQLDIFGKNLIDEVLHRYASQIAAPEKEVIDANELCKRLNISIPTQLRWRQKGKLPYLELGGNIRYDWHAVLKALEK